MREILHPPGLEKQIEENSFHPRQSLSSHILNTRVFPVNWLSIETMGATVEIRGGIGASWNSVVLVPPGTLCKG